MGAVLLVLLVTGPTVVCAQEMLTLSEAMSRARTATPDARALTASAQEATERIRQARAGYFPRVDVAESVQRGDQPVFVFSSLLAQRRFATENFAIDQLNHPSAVTNTRTALAVDQPLYDAGLTRLAVEGAELARDLTETTRAGATQDLAVRAARAFVRVLQLESARLARTAAVDAAESDRQRAAARREVGVATDADVLAVDVHLADMRQEQLAVLGDLAVARLELNEAIGAPLDTALILVPPVRAAGAANADALVASAVTSRSEVREAELRASLAANQRRTAQAAFIPRVGVQGGWEFNGPRVSDQQSSWLVGAQVEINVFRGLGDSARIAEAKQAELRAAADRERVHRAIEVEVRAALARLDAARARADAGRSARMQARESQRIIRDRYEGGLATITDVLRAAEAVLDADSRATAAEMDVIGAAVALDRAVGRM